MVDMNSSNKITGEENRFIDDRIQKKAGLIYNTRRVGL
jgi:hypothetical protein